MKRIIFISVFLFFLAVGFAQKSILIYDTSKDSNYVLSNLKNVNDELHFCGGNMRKPNPKMVSFFHGAPIVPERHIFEMKLKTGVVSKKFHHTLENQFVRPEKKILDTAEIFKCSFYSFSDTSGVFLPSLEDGSFLIKNDDFYEKKALPDSWSSCKAINEDVNFSEKFLVNFSKKNKRQSHQIGFIDKKNFSAHSILPNSFNYQTFHYHSFSEGIIFQAHGKLPERKSGLFILDKALNLKQINQFPKNLQFVKLHEIFNEKILVELTDPQKKGSSQIWEYNLKSASFKKLISIETGKYFRTPVFFKDCYFFSVGHKDDYELWYYENDRNFGEIDSLLRLKYENLTLIPFGDFLYFLDRFEMLYRIGKDGYWHQVTGNYLGARNLKLINNRLIFTATIDDMTRDFFEVNTLNNKAHQISNIKIDSPTGGWQRYYIRDLELNDSRYFLLEAAYGGHNSRLCFLDDSGFKLIEEDIRIDRNNVQPDTAVIRDDFFYLKKAPGSKFYNQIWKLKLNY